MENFVYWIKDHFCENILTDGYVGVSKNPLVRFKSHIRHNERIPTNSTMQIIFSGTRAECFIEEKRLRPIKNIGWNRAPGGAQGFKEGFVHSEKTKEALRVAWNDERRKIASKFKAEQNHKLLGQKRPKQSEAMVGENNPMFGKERTLEVKQKLRDANLGRASPFRHEFYCIGCKQQASKHVIINRHIKCFKRYLET